MMEINQEQKLEKHLNLVSKISLYFQFIAGSFAIFIMIKQPVHYQAIGKSFSIGALISSFVIARVYIYFGKRLEGLKTFSSKEKEFRKKEYFYKFFASYPLWLIFTFLFSVV